MHTRLLVLRALTKRLRRIPGTAFLLEPVRRRFVRTDDTVVIQDFDGDLKMEVALSGHMSSQIFWYGSYNRHELRVLDEIVEPGMTVVDVGANAGEVTLFCAKRVGVAGRVLAFEPMPTVADRLERNIAMNALTQVDVYRCGLADAPGTASLFTNVAAEDGRSNEADGTNNEGLSTLYPRDDREWESFTIELTTLDALVDRGELEALDVLKIDVEGAEMAVLRGAQRALERFRPWIVVEVQDVTARAADHGASEILTLLEALDYEFYQIDRRRRMRSLTSDRLGEFQNVLACPAGRRPPGG